MNKRSTEIFADCQLAARSMFFVEIGKVFNSPFASSLLFLLFYVAFGDLDILVYFTYTRLQENIC